MTIPRPRMLQRKKFDAVYYYMRSLMASNPFFTARDSLLALFDENRKKVNAELCDSGFLPILLLNAYQNDIHIVSCARIVRANRKRASRIEGEEETGKSERERKRDKR